jgi:hypothetical protein
MGDSASSSSLIFEGDNMPTIGYPAEIGSRNSGSVTAGDFEFDNMTIEFDGSSVPSGGNPATLLSLESWANVTLNNMVLISGPIQPIDVNAGHNVTIENSTIIGSQLTAHQTDDVFMNNDQFYMAWAQTAVGAINATGSHDFNLTNTTFQDYDDAATNASGFGSRRILYFPPDYAVYNFYVADNSSINLTYGGGDPNSGEEILSEGGDQDYYGGISSASGTTLTYNDTVRTPNDGDSVIVTSGTGLGQMRVVTGVSTSGSTTTLTLNSDWNVNPDSSSVVEIAPATTDSVIYQNSFQAATPANSGINDGAALELSDGGSDDVFADNTVNDLGVGVNLSSNVNLPNDFIQVTNNTFENMLNGGVRIQPNYGGIGPDSDPNNIGVVVRSNSISGPVGIELDKYSGSAVALAVLEHNTIQVANAGVTQFFNPSAPNGGLVIYDDPDVLFYQNSLIAPSSGTPAPGVLYLQTVSSGSAILLRDNTYTGFGSTPIYSATTGVTLPGAFFASPYDVLTETISAGDSGTLTIPLWDDGSTSSSWSASIPSGQTPSFVSFTSGGTGSLGSGSPSEDDSSDGVGLTLDTTGLSAGDYFNYLAVTVGSVTKYFGIWLTVD